MIHFTLIDPNLVSLVNNMLGMGIFFSGDNVYVSHLNFTISADSLVPENYQINGPNYELSKSAIAGDPTVLSYWMKTKPKSIAKYDFTAGLFN